MMGNRGPKNKVWTAGAAAVAAAVMILAAACGPFMPSPAPGAREPAPGSGTAGRWTAGSPEGAAVQVVTTTFPLFDFVRTIGSQRTYVIFLGEGDDPHNFDPSPRDLELLASSSLVIYNGAGLEPWLEPALEALTSAPPGAETDTVPGTPRTGASSVGRPGAVDTTSAIELLPRGGSDTEVDPHVWLDPLLAREQVDIILKALVEADADGRPVYERNARRLKDRLHQLHLRYETELGRCRSGVLAVEHPAFTYLARRYQLEQIALAPADHDMEPSPRHLARIVLRLRAEGVKAVFATDGSDGQLAETAALETGARVLSLHPLEVLSREQRDQGDDYFTLMEKNLENLKEGLECT